MVTGEINMIGWDNGYLYLRLTSTKFFITLFNIKVHLVSNFWTLHCLSRSGAEESNNCDEQEGERDFREHGYSLVSQMMEAT